MDNVSISTTAGVSRARSCPPCAAPRRSRAPSLPLDLSSVPVTFLVPASSAARAVDPPPPRPMVAPLGVGLSETAVGFVSSPASSSSDLFVTPGPHCSTSPGPPRSPSFPAGSAGVVQLTPWEQATVVGSPVPTAKRQRTFDLMKSVEESGAECPPGSVCALCASTGARCFVSGVAASQKCSFCIYKAVPCSLAAATTGSSRPPPPPRRKRRASVTPPSEPLAPRSSRRARVVPPSPPAPPDSPGGSLSYSPPARVHASHGSSVLRLGEMIGGSSASVGRGGVVMGGGRRAVELRGIPTAPTSGGVSWGDDPRDARLERAEERIRLLEREVEHLAGTLASLRDLILRVGGS